MIKKKLNSRVLKDENKSLKRDIAESCQSSTGLRRELVELRRELEKVEDKKLQAELDVQDLNKEIESRRDDITEVRTQNNALRFVKLLNIDAVVLPTSKHPTVQLRMHIYYLECSF